VVVLRAHSHRQTVDATLSALADPARRGVIDLLLRKPRRASDLAHALKLSRPAMSRHLKVLRDVGIVEPANDDADLRARVYRLKLDALADLRDWLAEIDRFWTSELSAFKQHAERQKK